MHLNHLFAVQKRTSTQNQKAQEQTWQPVNREGVTSQQIVFEFLYVPVREAGLFSLLSFCDLLLLLTISCPNH